MSNKYPSQEKEVLNHLELFGTITSLEAFLNYDITCLSSIIYRLRKRGYNIETELIQYTNIKKGRKGSYAIYTLME